MVTVSAVCREIRLMDYPFMQDEREASRKSLVEDVSRLQGQRSEADKRCAKAENAVSLLRKDIVDFSARARQMQDERDR